MPDNCIPIPQEGENISWPKVTALLLSSALHPLGLAVTLCDGDGRHVTDRVRARDIYVDGEGLHRLFARHLLPAPNMSRFVSYLRAARPETVQITHPWWAWSSEEEDEVASRLMRRAWQGYGPWGPNWVPPPGFGEPGRPVYWRRRIY